MTTALEKLRRELELDKCKELERLQAEHAKELRQLTDKHQQVVSEIKKKQWVIFELISYGFEARLPSSE